MNNLTDLKKLEELKKRVKFKRLYEWGGTTVEVDGAFLRIDESLMNQYESCKKINSLEYIGIAIDDLLQDPAIIRSARVSTARELQEVNEKAAGLIGSLYKGVHETPFEGGVMFRFRVRTPICFAPPFFQLPGSHNEFSLRYSKIDESESFYLPPQAAGNGKIKKIYDEAEKDSKYVYGKLNSLGVANEQARFALPFRFFTRFYWTVSLRHLLELLALEKNDMAPEEFWQIRDNIFPEIIKDWTPWVYDKFNEFKRALVSSWHSEIETPDAFEILSKQAILEGAVLNIGKVWLLDDTKNGFSELLFRLGAQTGPNPRKGFGHNFSTFLIDAPIFVHRQWVRHRYGTWSELPIDFDGIAKKCDFYLPVNFRKQTDKAMSYHFENLSNSDNARAYEILYGLLERSIERYWRLRSAKVPASVAAQNLPYIFRVKRPWTVNHESLINYFSLRCDEHAQWETRQFANVIYPWFKERFPLENEIFLKYLNFGKSDIFKPE